MENTTTVIEEPKVEQLQEVTTKTKPKRIQDGSRLHYVRDLFNSGIKDVATMATKLKELEEAGKIKGLKKTDESFLAQKDDKFYKRIANWYMNKARKDGWIDMPAVTRKKKEKAKKELMEVAQSLVDESTEYTDSSPEVTAEEIAQAVESIEVSETQSSEEIIPTL